MNNIDELKLLYDSKTLKNGIKKLAKKINSDFKTITEPVVLVCVLKGAVMFYTELSKHLSMPIDMEFIKVSSYGNEFTSSNKINVQDFDITKFKNKNVLVVEDIIDSGLTLNFIMSELSKVTKTLKLAVLLNKKCNRQYNVNVDYSVFDVDNKFIVGFGFDYKGLYRNLDYIGYVDN